MEDTFPYKRFSLPDTPEQYFERARLYQPVIQEIPVAIANKLLGPNAVVSKTSRQAFLKHFPLDFRYSGKALIIRTPKGSYENINVFPDYYTEYARIRDIGAYERISPYQFWMKNRDSIRGKFEDLHQQREYIWKNGPIEARQGKITTYLSLFKILGSRVVLDPSAAWGDRLIAALASPGVEAYTGVDPHSRLAAGWTAILKDLLPLSDKKDSFHMLNEPFETETSSPLPQDYDTVLVSTAPLVGDKYDIDNPEQAGNRYGSSLRDYVSGFLIPYLKRCIQALKIGGYLCITVLDRARDGYYITELELLIVERLGMHYRGVIWSEGDSGKPVPWWIFLKKEKPPGRERMLENDKLYRLY